MQELYSDYDGSTVQNASDLDFFTEDTCDGCDKPKYGKMIHAAGATGRVCPVLFLCGPCRGNKDEDYTVEEYDDSMDGDWNSGMASAGWGTDEDYGYYGDD